MKQRYLWILGLTLLIIYLMMQILLYDKDIFSTTTGKLVFIADILAIFLTVGLFTVTVAAGTAIIWPRKDRYKSRFIRVLPVSLIAVLIILIFSTVIFGQVKSIKLEVKPPLSTQLNKTEIHVIG